MAFQVIINLGNLSRKVYSCLYSIIQIPKNLQIYSRPWEINQSYSVDNFFVDLDGISIMFDLIEQIDKTLFDEFPLVIAHTVFWCIVLGLNVIFKMS